MGMYMSITKQEFEFSSSVDGVGPLYGDASFLPSGGRRPVIVVMHGYGDDRLYVAADVERLAGKGLFAVSIDMRGRGKSAGQRDSAAVEIADIVDGVRRAVELFPDHADATNLNILGYSGGGGNALSAVTKFPGLFRMAISFFGISDYAMWYRSEALPDCNATMLKDIGGTPDEVPDAWQARNSLWAAGNAAWTEVHLFWDEEETGCPPELNTSFAKACEGLSPGKCVVHESKKGDPARWHHGYTTDWPELIEAEELFVPQMLAGSVPQFELPPCGHLAVAGFVVTSHFLVWVGDGRSGVAEIEYALSEGECAVTIHDSTAGQPVEVVTSQ